MSNKREKYYYVWVMGIAALFGGAFWLADGIYQYYFFHKNLKFLLLEGPESLMDSIVFNIPPRAILVRISFIIACLIGGILVAVFLHRQHEAQKRLRESESQLSRAQQIAKIGSWSWDLKTDESKWSDEMYHVFGLIPGHPEHLNHDTFLSRVHPGDREFVASTLKTSSKKKGFTDFEFRTVPIDGQERVVHAYGEVICDDSGKPVWMIGTYQDITKQKQAEEALRESELKYKTLFEGAAEGVLVADIETHEFKYANPAICEMLGYTKEELIEMDVGDLHPKKALEDVISEFEAQARGEKTLAPNIPCLRKDGSTIYADIRTTRIMIGGIECNVGLFADITERKRVDEELEQYHEHLEKMVRDRTAELDKRISEVEQLNSAMVNLLEDLRVSNENLELTATQLRDTNKELESFSYSVSHDLRAPLRAIDGFSQILVEDYGDKLDEDGQHQLDVIQDSARQMGQLIDDLLAFSRLGRKGMSMSEIDMGVLVKEVFEQLQLGKTERTARLNIDTLPPGKGDRAMIREVLVNLLSNAMKFTRPGKAPVIEVYGKVDENENVYSVKDKGVGYDMKYADKLFQVFQRLHSAEEYEGTGIGLALVQRIIHRHGGRVWAEGKVNKGATFYFSLPIS